MQIQANTPLEYISKLPEGRQPFISKLRNTILASIPSGFEEQMNYGMIGYVVPHSLYPAGYHCDTSLPLPFANIASQKNFIALYHMGIYADNALLEWFVDAYSKVVPTKLDMGKSCIRFKKPELIPYELIGELMSKMTVDQWINLYESAFKKK